MELTGSNISGWDTQPEITDEVVIGGGTSGITTYEALHEALQTGGGSADAPTLITLGSDITIPAGGSSSSRTYINGSGYFKIDGGGHTLAWEAGSYYFLGNANTDADAVYIELTNIKLVQAPNSYSAVVGVCNGRITLGGNVILDGNGNMPVIVVSDEKAALELGDGCELSYAAGSSGCAKVMEGATLVLNGGKTADGAYINLNCILPVSNPLISVPKALTDDVHLKLYLVDIISIAGGTGGYQLTQADCDHLIVNPESMVSLYGGQSMKYDGNFEIYLDPADHQIKLCPKGFPPPTSGDIDMTSMTADEAQLTIRAALAAGYAAFCNGSFLVIDDENHPNYKKLMRPADAGINAPEKLDKDGKPVDQFICIDAETNQLAITDNCSKGVLDFEGEVNGVKVRTGFAILTESVNEYTIEEYSEITGVSVEDIERIAKEFTSHGQKVSVCHKGGECASVHGVDCMVGANSCT